MISLCPKSACTNLKSAPPSNKCVAKECRSTWGEMDLFIPEKSDHLFKILLIIERVSGFPFLLKNTTLDLFCLSKLGLT